MDEKRPNSKQLSQNVQRMRFMQAKKIGQQRENLNVPLPISEPEWMMIDEDEYKNMINSEGFPKTFNEEHSIERINVHSHHRRSFQAFNPFVEKNQKIIASRIARSVNEAEADMLTAQSKGAFREL